MLYTHLIGKIVGASSGNGVTEGDLDVWLPEKPTGAVTMLASRELPAGFVLKRGVFRRQFSFAFWRPTIGVDVLLSGRVETWEG